MSNDQGLQVIQPGFLAFLQDQGRHGYLHLGISPSGPLDEFASIWANRLLGNNWFAQTIEIVVGGMKLLAQCDTNLVVTGAQAPIYINGVRYPNWQTCHVSEGDLVEIGHAPRGLRSYLAVSGGFQSALEFGSCAPLHRERLGGLHQDGKPIQGGDLLPCTSHQPARVRSLNSEFIPKYPTRLRIRLIPGYQYPEFDHGIISALLNSAFILSADSDRTGLRLKSISDTKIDLDPVPLRPEAISFGTLQIPPDEQPIIMLKDRHTFGSYPKLGSILPIDCFKLSQLMLGSQITIETIKSNEAIQLMRQFYGQFASEGEDSTVKGGS